MAITGIVKSITGIVTATDVNGNTRTLQLGDLVYSDEVITTGDAAGTTLLIEFSDGSKMDLAGASTITLNEDALNPEPNAHHLFQDAQSAQAAQDEVARIQQALARGEDFDPSKLPPTAAGGAPGAASGGNEGHTFVQVDYLKPSITPDSGFNTQGISVAFPPPPEVLILNPPAAPGELSANDLDDQDENVSTNEDTQVAGNVLDNTFNPDGPQEANVTQFSWGGNVNVGAGETAFIEGVGTLVINANGSFSFTPAENYDGAVPQAIYTLTDGTDTNISTLAIDITPVNDPPVAVNDTNSIGEDDGALVATTTLNGVLLNDTDIDSDTLTVTSVRTGSTEGSGVEGALNTVLNGSYGALTLHADGSYTYALYPQAGNAAAYASVQALRIGETLHDYFNYTLSDGSLTDTAVLDISINGSDDSAAVVTITAIGEVNTVFEHGLISAEDTSESATGTFTVAATDGILNLVVGGSTFTLAEMQGFNGTQTVSTGEGLLQLDSYVGDAFGGTVNYTYTLSATIDNDSKVPSGNDAVTPDYFDDSVHITVNGVGGTTASDDLVLRAIDDVPGALNDGPAAVAEDGTSFVSGNVLVNDASGADTPKVFDSWSAVGQDNTSSMAALSQYGTLEQNGDGSWSYALNNADADTQALTAADHLSYDLWYTMTDADGDASAAKLTITIDGADDSASVVTAAAQGPDNTVFEHGLISAEDTSESATGTFTVAATDGILNLVVGGSTYTLAQMQAFDGTQTVNTGEGLLQLDSYAGDAFSGTVNYTYTLSATIDNDSKVPSGNDAVTPDYFNDSVHLTVNGVGGTSAGDDLVLRAIDDVPGALDDGPAATTEDGISFVSGNVLDNDASGADTPKVFDSWSAVGQDNTSSMAELSQYGTLEQNGDGSWSYALNNADADTQALTAADHLSYDLWYTMTDADGDASAAKLTITIDGADDSARVTTSAVQGADGTVFEAGLNPNGSDAASNSETTSGAFTVAATDGILNLVIGGSTFTLAEMQAFDGSQTVDTGEGLLQLDSYVGDAFGGTVNYTYTLSAAINNEINVPSGDSATLFLAPIQAFNGTQTSNDIVTMDYFDDSVHLTVNGVGGTSAGDDLVLRAIDDVPGALNDGPAAVTEDGTSFVSGNVLDNDASGADTPKVFDSWSAVGQDNTSSMTALSQYGTLEQNGDGSWSYALNNADADTQALTATDHLAYDLWYTMKDGDGDESIAKLTITIDGADDSASVVTAAAQGPDNTVFEAGLNPNGSDAAANSETTSGAFTVAATDGILNLVIGGSTFTLAEMQAFDGSQTVNTGEGLLQLDSYAGGAFSGTVNYTYTLSAAIDNDSKVPSGDDTVTPDHFDDSVHLTVNGVGGTSAGDELVVRVMDDNPMAVDDSATVAEAGRATTDVVLMIDQSESMVGEPFIQLKSAVEALFNSGNVHSVFLTSFASTGTFYNSGTNGGWYTNLDDALAVVNGLTNKGGTDYDAALAAVTANFMAPPPGGDRLVSMFLSDGRPNRSSTTDSTGIDEDDISGNPAPGGEETDWINFLNSQGFDESFAFGFGGLTEKHIAFLEPIAWTGPAETADDPYDADITSSALNDPNVTILHDITDLGDALISTVASSVTGNVLTNDVFGADGGRILSITIDGTTYTWNGDNTITRTGTDPGVDSGKSISVHTGLGGIFIFYFETSGAHLAGSWTYASPSVDSNQVESLRYVIVDGDGDLHDAGLSITVNNVNQAPEANDVFTSGNEGAAAIAVTLDGTDSDGTVAAYILASLPSNGSLYLNDGHTPAVAGMEYVSPDFQFTPSDHFHGDVSFQYTVKDNEGSFDLTPATATLSINALPDAVDDILVMRPTDDTVIQSAWLLRNDTDADSSLSILDVDRSGLDDPNSTVTNPGVSFLIDPNGDVDFTYRAHDGMASDQAKVDVQADSSGNLAGETGNVDQILVGGSGNDIINGGDGDDILFGGDGTDVLNGGPGNDWLVWDNADSFNGGSGFDTLRFETAQDLNIDNDIGDKSFNLINLIDNIEAIDLRNGSTEDDFGNRESTALSDNALSADDVIKMTDSDNILYILGDGNGDAPGADDAVRLSGSWTEGPTATVNDAATPDVNGQSFTQYTSGLATVFIQDTINVDTGLG